MIRARMSNGTFILGLDGDNVERLQRGQPILVDLSEMGGSDVVLLMFGLTQHDILEALKEANGGTLPVPQPYVRGGHA
jgi:hypothetical protein